MENTPPAAQQTVDIQPIDKATKVFQGVYRFFGAMIQGVIVTLVAQFMFSTWQNPIVNTIIKTCFESAVKTGLHYLPVALHSLVPILVIGLPLIALAGIAYFSINWQTLRNPEEHIDQSSFTIFSFLLPLIGGVLAMSLGGLGIMTASMMTFAATTLASSYFLVYQQCRIDDFQREKIVNAPRQPPPPPPSTGLQSTPGPASEGLQQATDTSSSASVQDASIPITHAFETSRTQSSQPASTTSAPSSEQSHAAETQPTSLSP